ncbi:DUF58 domain-containing protein [Dictyobacter arantiisoli]|uniref:DUF58 domain-containing protein n=1 Tax=Dictyobacter arantiisoli TaxID=2014874 RepID=A0A5A5T5M3_9CHLR|nr:DUF58 domain-containing protein [Dictyobacter arantiisoli]GCF06505.1 hypothetical protein KDI_00690 [Dictyobacter arantiisoli]
MMNLEQKPLTLLEEHRQVLKRRRPWYYLALVLLLLSALTRVPFLILAAAFTLLIGIVPELWYRAAQRHLLIRQQVEQHHLFFGEQMRLTLTIENRKLLPLPWLQIDDIISPPLTVTDRREKRLSTIRRDTLTSTWLLWSYQRVTRRYRMLCHARGFHLLGPIQLHSSDPLGWLQRELIVPAHETLLVYPLITRLENLGLPSIFPMGDRVGRRQLLEDPLWFAGNREYQLGDDPRRIDWKATARVGSMRSKIYESTTERRLLILLDTWTYSKELQSMDLDLQEFAISVAASLATWGLDEGYMVGLLTNCAMVTTGHSFSSEINTDQILTTTGGQSASSLTFSPPGVSLPFASDDAHYEQILTTLARLLPTANTPIERVLELEDNLFPAGTTVMLISSINTLNETVLEDLRIRAKSGNAINLMLIGDLEADKELLDTENFPTYTLGGMEKWHALIQASVNGQDDVASPHSLQMD